MFENDGLLNIHKPSGVTSFGIVKKVKRILGVKKVGHCGTLDPMAEGVLLVVFGAATKMQSSLMAGRKSYRARFILGTVTDTGDITGQIVRQNDVPAVTAPDIESILARFRGDIEQIPPMYSALKYGGRPLYSFARKGEEVERLPRRITIYRLELATLTLPVMELEIECSRGTYVRTLGEDIGAALGCGATMEYLCREQVYPFTLEDAIDGKMIDEFDRNALLEKRYSLEYLKSLP